MLSGFARNFRPQFITGWLSCERSGLSKCKVFALRQLKARWVVLLSIWQECADDGRWPMLALVPKGILDGERRTSYSEVLTSLSDSFSSLCLLVYGEGLIRSYSGSGVHNKLALQRCMSEFDSLTGGGTRALSFSLCLQ